MIDLTTALPTFVVTLREGFEAALVVGIVMACLKQARQTQLYFWVYLGILGGIIASIAIGLLLVGTIAGIEAKGGIYTPVVKQLLEGIFGIVAIAMLSWMLLWMTQQAKSVRGEVTGAINEALTQNNASKAVFLLIFIAVLREGFETVLFILAKFQEQLAAPTLGAVGGLILATVMGVSLFALGIKIDIRLFFQVMGIFLLLIVGGLVIGTLKHFDTAIALLSQISATNWCIADSASCILGTRIWDGSQLLPDSEFPGIIFKALFGYRQTLYLGQIIAYVSFLVVIGTAYFQSLTANAKQSVMGNSQVADSK